LRLGSSSNWKALFLRGGLESLGVGLGLQVVGEEASLSLLNLVGNRGVGVVGEHLKWLKVVERVKINLLEQIRYSLI